MQSDDFVFAETQEVTRAEPLPFTAVSVFQGALTPETIASALLEEYSSVEAYVICKKWAELFSGSGSGENKKTGAADIVKQKAVFGVNEKKMPIIFNGVTVAEVSPKSLPEQWLHEDTSLNVIDAEIEVLKEKRKARAEFLKTVPQGTYEESTGAMVIPSRRITAGSTIAVKWK